MKHLVSLSIIISLVMVSQHVIAQSGGFDVKNVSASNSLTVGTASESVVVLSESVTLPPLTNSEIALLGIPAKGSLVYSSDSDVLLVFDGIWWKRMDGQNNNYMNPCENTFYDQDGNPFQGVSIGNQCWMAENLKVTNYPNGDPIPYITIGTEWGNLGDNNTDDGYCYFNNNTNSEYGALYTYAAAIADDWGRDNTDGQGICPDGWHLPTDAEWTELTTYLGGETVAGGKMKETGYTHWLSPNSGATNTSRFTALPGGFRNYSSPSSFFDLTYAGYWWTATTNGFSKAYNRKLTRSDAEAHRNDIYGKSHGFSVRCVKN